MRGLALTNRQREKGFPRCLVSTGSLRILTAREELPTPSIGINRLEDILQCELEDSRIPGFVDPTKIAPAQACTRV